MNRVINDMVSFALRSFTVLVLLLSATATTVSQTDLSGPLHETTLRGIDSLYNLRFDGADAAFDEAIRIAPKDPRGWFFKSMVSFYIYQLTQDQAAYEKFMELSDVVIERAEDLVDEDDTNLTAKFYLGGIYGYRGLAFQRNGSLLSALWDGRKGYGYLRDAATGPNFSVDAKFGFGLFTYLVAKIPRSFSWVFGILGFSGDLEGGLDMMRAAADSGVYTRTEASFYYAQFCFFEQRYDNAYTYIQRIIDAYPRNSLFLVTFAAWELRQNRIDEAIAVAERAIEVNRKNEIQTGDEFAHSTLAAAYYVRNEFPNAAKHWERYIDLTENKANISNYVYYRLGIVYEILGDRPKAVAAWKTMRETTDEDRPWDSVYWRRARMFLGSPISRTYVLIILGSNFDQVGRTREAIQYFELAAEFAWDDQEARAVALCQKIQALDACREYQEVLDLAPKVMQINPREEVWTIPHTLYYLGLSHKALDHPKEARQVFEHALRFEEYDWEVRLRNRIEQQLEDLDGDR